MKLPELKSVLLMIMILFSLPKNALALIYYPTLSIDSFSWSQTRSGITVDAHATALGGYSSNNDPLCYESELKHGEIVQARACYVTVIVKTLTGERTKRLTSNGNISSISEGVNLINGLSYLSRDSLSLWDNDVVVSVCLNYAKTTDDFDGYAFFNGVCNGNDVIPPTPSPESCEINTNNNIVDFGKISASAFSDAGVGNKPSGVNPQYRNVSIQCTSNSPDITDAYLLLTTTESSGKLIVSSNKDVGFIIQDNAGESIYPNDFSKLMHFNLDESHSANVPVTITPVSVTGNKPAAGEFSAVASLEVFFD